MYSAKKKWGLKCFGFFGLVLILIIEARIDPAETL
jgi:hypothetical protein